jgi:hypothetical protein
MGMTDAQIIEIASEVATDTWGEEYFHHDLIEWPENYPNGNTAGVVEIANYDGDVLGRIAVDAAGTASLRNR